MQTIPVNKKALLETHKQGDCAVKQALEILVGKKVFTPVFDRIKSFEDACVDLGKDPVAEMAAFDMLPENIRKKHRALYRCDIITEALNEGWEADYNNSEEKWWNWYYLDKPGFRFFVSFFTDSYSGSYSTGGSRPFASKQIAEYFAKQFLHEIKDVMVS